MWRSLVLAMLMSCAQVPQYESPSEAEEQKVNIPTIHTSSVPDGGAVTSGSRLKIGYLVSRDGSRSPSGFYFDTELDTKCLMDFVNDQGSISCVPFGRQKAERFSDALCTQGIVEDTGTDIVVVNKGKFRRYYRVGPRYTERDAFVLNGVHCATANELVPNAHFLSDDLTDTLVSVEEVFE